MDSVTKVLVDLCSKRARLYNDFVLGRVPFDEYSKKVEQSLKLTEIEYMTWKREQSTRKA